MVNSRSLAGADMLNLKQLAQFMTIARTGSLAAAAEELNVSSPALSKNLATLERQTGIKLFDRAGRGLLLTRAGTEFVDQAEELLGHADEVLNRLQASAVGSAGRLYIGTGPAALQGPVADTVAAVMAANPGIAIEVETGRTADLLTGLRRYRYDFLVADAGDVAMSREVDRYLVQPLPAEPIVLACSRAHPLAARRRVRVSEALEYPWVTPYVPPLLRDRVAAQLRDENAPARAFARLAALPDVRIEDLNSCMQIAADGHCLAVTLESKTLGKSFPGSLKILPANLGLWTNVAVISLKRRTPTPLASKMLASLTEADSRFRGDRKPARR